MANIFLSSEERGIVVFKVGKSLSYNKRMLISFSLIFLGFIVQYLTLSNFAGMVFGGIIIFIGNLFLLVSGYDNRVKVGKYDPSAKWEKVTIGKLLELERLDKKIQHWDKSATDITNGIGCLTFGIILIAVVGTFWIGKLMNNEILPVIAVDLGILLIPHWMTGTRNILTKPKLLLKIKVIKDLLQTTEQRVKQHDLDFYVLLKGKESKIPDDVKFRVNITGQNPDFLGFYGQVVINMVQSHAYPYFYVVLVAKKGFGLDKAFNKYIPPEDVTKEFKYQGEVEVLVIRQTTTETSGYHTKDEKIVKIFLSGLELAEKVAVK